MEVSLRRRDHYLKDNKLIYMLSNLSPQKSFVCVDVTAINFFSFATLERCFYIVLLFP